MKKIIIILWAVILSVSGNAVAQSAELQQLVLNIEKLAQLRKILKNMYQGYAIVSKGYNTIKAISKGTFSIHEGFLDGLMQVSPSVRKYKRIADIITLQMELVQGYKSALKRFQSSNIFKANEIGYIRNVYNNLFKRSLQNLDELTMTITAGKLRMSDDERINTIDRIYNDIGDKVVFLKSFNKENNVLVIQRGREMVDTKISKKLNGL